MKTKQIGGISFTEKGYEGFKKLSKSKQIEQVYNSLSPKDYKKAEKLLKDVPNGDIISGNEQTDKKDNRADASGTNGGDNSSKSKTDKGSQKG